MRHIKLLSVFILGAEGSFDTGGCCARCLSYSERSVFFKRAAHSAGPTCERMHRDLDTWGLAPHRMIGCGHIFVAFVTRDVGMPGFLDVWDVGHLFFMDFGCVGEHSLMMFCPLGHI